MEKLFDYIKLFIIALGTGFTWLFGVWDIPLVVLVVFMVLDQLTGVSYWVDNDKDYRNT